jgi:hypothetical protein
VVLVKQYFFIGKKSNMLRQFATAPVKNRIINQKILTKSYWYSNGVFPIFFSESRNVQPDPTFLGRARPNYD